MGRRSTTNALEVRFPRLDVVRILYSKFESGRYYDGNFCHGIERGGYQQALYIYQGMGRDDDASAALRMSANLYDRDDVMEMRIYFKINNVSSTLVACFGVYC